MLKVQNTEILSDRFSANLIFGQLSINHMFNDIWVSSLTLISAFRNYPQYILGQFDETLHYSLIATVSMPAQNSPALRRSVSKRSFTPRSLYGSLLVYCSRLNLGSILNISRASVRASTYRSAAQ